MNHLNIKSLTGTALCIALGLVLPSIFHVFGAGTAFSPMHIPVFLCGLCFGGLYGLFCGFMTPIVSSILTGMPPLYPVGLVMILELSLYGYLSGLLYRKFDLNIYLSMIIAMLIGRICAGLLSTVVYGIAGTGYGFSAFVSGYFISAIPGIIVQLIVIPILVFVLEKANVIKRPTIIKE